MKRFGRLILGLGAAAALSTSAFAGTTSFNTGGELGGGAGISLDGPTNEFPDVLKAYYGGSGYSGNVNTAFTISGVAGGDLTFTRIVDTGGSGNLALDGTTAATADDRNWQDGTTNLKVDAVVADLHQNFGYETGGTNHTIFSNQTSGGASASNIHIGPGTFHWFDRATDASLNTIATYYSNPAQNTNDSGASAFTSQDHMVTFLITQNGNAYDPSSSGALATWLVAFEDTDLAKADADYQDLVVQVTAVGVPVPAAAWMGLITLAGLGGAALLRRRRMA